MSENNSNQEMKKGEFSFRQLAKRIVFSLVVLLLVLIVLDLAAWIIVSRNLEHRITTPDKDLFYRLVPGASAKSRVGKGFPAWWKQDSPRVDIVINKDGYRGERVPPDKPPGEFRIICLGDSITMGLGVGEGMTYPAQLASLLRERLPGKRISVLNAGVLGYTSRQGLFLVKSRFLDYRPDVVIWGFGFNDRALIPMVDNLDISLIPLEPGSFSGWRSFKKRAFFWLWCRPLAQIIHGFIIPVAWQARVGRMIPLLEGIKELPQITRSADYFDRSRVPPRDFEIHLLEMNDLAHEYNFKLIVARFLGTPDFYSDVARRFCSSHNTVFIDFNRLFGQVFLAKELPEHPGYRQMFRFYEKSLQPGALDKNPMLYITSDGLHPNNIGHHIIASTIAKVLEREFR